LPSRKDKVIITKVSKDTSTKAITKAYVAKDNMLCLGNDEELDEIIILVYFKK